MTIIEKIIIINRTLTNDTYLDKFYLNKFKILIHEI